MSHITNAILVFGISERAEERLEEIHSYLDGSYDRERTQEFNFVQKHAGGGKVFTDHVAMAAFNYVAQDIIVSAIETARWGTLDQVMLLVNRETDINYSVWKFTDDGSMHQVVKADEW